jgi:chemotaxis protein CheX
METYASTRELPTTGDFASIVAQVWQSFLDSVIVEEPDPSDAMLASFHTEDRVVGWVSITGDWSGHLLVTTSSAGAREIAAGLFELGVDEVGNDEVADAVGEVANVVGGAVKGMISEACSLSLPQVVFGAGMIVHLGAEERTTVRLMWKQELIEVSLWEACATANNGGAR